MKQMTNNSERRVRLQEAWTRLGVSKRTFYRRVAEQVYPEPLRDGGIRFYLESVLTNLLGASR